MWMLRHKRFVIAMAACSAALALNVGCSDDDGVGPTEEGGAGGAGGSGSAGKAGNAAAGKAGAATAGASGSGTSGSGSSTAGSAGDDAGAAGTGTAGAGAGGGTSGSGGTAGGSAGSGGKGGTAGTAGSSAGAGGTAGGSAGAGGKGGSSGGTSAGAGGGGGTAGSTAGAGGGGGTAGSSAGAGGTSGSAGSSAGTGGNGGSGGAPFVPVPITVLNAAFETGNDNQPAQNWQSTGDTAASYVHYNQSSAHGGYGYLAFYNAAAYTVDTFQTINGLTNGTYEFSAWVEGATPVTIYATNYSAVVVEKKTDITPTASYVKYSVTAIPVTNGKITIGVRSTSAAGAWANIDDVTLTRVQ